MAKRSDPLGLGKVERGLGRAQRRMAGGGRSRRYIVDVRPEAGGYGGTLLLFGFVVLVMLVVTFASR